MSSDAGVATREAGDDQDSAADVGPAVDDYSAMIDTLDVAIEEAQRKIESGRVYDAKNEKVRIKWIRALAYAINIRRQVTTDRDLEELTERLEQLESSTEVTTR